VYICFRTRRLGRCYQSLGAAEAEWGRRVARRYVQRIGVLKGIQQIKDLQTFPSLRYHPLKGSRKGQHAITLHGRTRLIFSVEGADPRVIRIEEVSQHYGD
jgi:proteic killer suppression protein